MMARTTLVRLSVVALVLVGGCKKKPPASAGDAGAPGAAEASSPTTEAAPASGNASARKLDRAVAMLEGGQQADALEARNLLRALTEETPDEALAWYNLGVAYDLLGARQDALSAFERASRAKPDLAEAWLAQGLELGVLGDADGALRRFDKGLESAPEAMALHVARIGALRDLGRTDDAVAAARKALAINANSLEVYNLMGLAYLDLGNVDLARFVYEKAERLEGAESNAVIQANFGWTLYRLGSRYAAENRLKRAVEIDPTFVPGLVYLARLYYEDRNFADMVPLLEQAVAKDPKNHGVLTNLGLAYRGLGRVEDARRVLESAAAADPSNPDTSFNLGILLGDDLKDYDGAIKAFNAYKDKGGDDAALADEYIEDVERERKKAEREKQRAEDKKKKAEQKAERERLLKEAEAAKPKPDAPPAEEPAEPSPWDTTDEKGGR